MRLFEIDPNYQHAPGFKHYIPTHRTIAQRFVELGINEAFPYFEDWIYHGAFDLPQAKLRMYEQAFHLINSVLPPEVLASYKELPTMYRVLKFKENQIKKIFTGGLPIHNRIMAWAPRNTAIRYKPYGLYAPYVMLKHQPKVNEVIISLNRPTLDFLGVGVGSWMVVNKEETILSLPILEITPDIISDCYPDYLSY